MDEESVLSLAVSTVTPSSPSTKPEKCNLEIINVRSAKKTLLEFSVKSSTASALRHVLVIFFTSVLLSIYQHEK